jgi:hypothetical protein
MKNYSNVKTPTTSQHWNSLSEDDKKKLIYDVLNNDINYEEFEVYKASDNGEIVFNINKTIPSDKRGLLLLNLEEKLKQNVDKGLTVWLEPVGDKSKLRNLRGIKIKPDRN